MTLATLLTLVLKSGSTLFDGMRDVISVSSHHGQQLFYKTQTNICFIKVFKANTTVSPLKITNSFKLTKNRNIFWKIFSQQILQCPPYY